MCLRMNGIQAAASIRQTIVRVHRSCLRLRASWAANLSGMALLLISGISDIGVSELTAELGQAIGEPGLDGPQADAEHLAHLLQRQLVLVVEDDDRAARR